MCLGGQPLSISPQEHNLDGQHAGRMISEKNITRFNIPPTRVCYDFVKSWEEIRTSMQNEIKLLLKVVHWGVYGCRKNVNVWVEDSSKD